MNKMNLLMAPTPLEPLPRLGEALGMEQLYIKRDDVAGRAGGGNKLRKFERQLAEAQSQGADTVIMAGHPQSNAVRMLASICASMGMKTIVPAKPMIDRETALFQSSGNKLLLDLLQVEFRWVPRSEDTWSACLRIQQELQIRGHRPYLLPFGGSNALGALGYADCAAEILTQCASEMGCEPDTVIVPCGTGGTLAGLVAGFSASGAKTEVLGFCVLKPATETEVAVAALIEETARELKIAVPDDNCWKLDDICLGHGYGELSNHVVSTIRRCASLEGLFLDPVYTGKAMSGFIKRAATDCALRNGKTVFVHTGGLPLLFAYGDAFT